MAEREKKLTVATNSRGDSVSFSESIIRGRDRCQRKQPWFRAMPVRRVIPTMYRGLYSSTHLQPFQLVSLGKTLLGFLKQQIDMPFTVGDWHHQNYLQIFDAIFGRLLTMKFVAGEGFQELLDSVWDLHNNGTIDFSKTTIPEKLVQICPLRLEQVLQACFTSSETSNIDSYDVSSSAPLIPLCKRSPENFLKVMEFLQEKFCTSTDPVIRRMTINFACNFVELLKSKLGNDYYSLYPSSFQPLLYFMCTLCLKNNADDENLFGNSFVIDEVLSLLDNLYYQSELMKSDISTVTFMLYTVSKVLRILSERKSSEMIQYHRWPWLKRVLKTTEFAQSFDSSLLINKLS